MTGMNMGYDGPPSVLQCADHAARGFAGIAVALRGPDHHPGDLSRALLRAARRQRRLDHPGHRAGSAHPHHPVAPQLVTMG